MLDRVLQRTDHVVLPHYLGEGLRSVPAVQGLMLFLLRHALLLTFPGARLGGNEGDRAPIVDHERLERFPARELRRGVPAAPTRLRLRLLPSGPDRVRGLESRRPDLQRFVPAAASDHPGLGWGFSPARADCGYRAPLAPHLARPGPMVRCGRSRRKHAALPMARAAARARSGGRAGHATLTDNDRPPGSALPEGALKNYLHAALVIALALLLIVVGITPLGAPRPLPEAAPAAQFGRARHGPAAAGGGGAASGGLGGRGPRAAAAAGAAERPAAGPAPADRRRGVAARPTRGRHGAQRGGASAGGRAPRAPCCSSLTPTRCPCPTAPATTAPAW